MTALRQLLEGIVDYAGLFPPAALGMGEAVRNFAVYRAGEHSWMVGRFIVPVSRLDECSSAATALPDELRNGPAWKLSALAGNDLVADIAAVSSFNRTRRTESPPLLVVDTIEFRADSAPRIDQGREHLPADLQAYVEIPIESDPAPLLHAIAGAGLRAKVRTGGVTPEAFPSSVHLARFIHTCVRSGLMFKATAGLHHALRGRYPLTYDAETPTGIMYGFLNVFFAAGVASTGGSEEEIRRMLEEADPRAIFCDRGGMSWRDHRLSADELAATRTRFAAAFGSCSFVEPVNDLLRMGLP